MNKLPVVSMEKKQRSKISNKMCKIKETNVGIKRLDFSEHRGKLCAVLTDGRVILVPISFFPDIQKLSVKEREDWMILDDQFFTFHNLSKVYAVTDLMRL